jgi:hypothetical protein
MPGIYRFDIPNAALASGNGRSVVIMLSGATNMAPLPIEIELTGWDNQDSVHGGMSALPNTACTTNASLITSGSGTDQLTVSGGVASADAKKINAVSTSSVTTINANVGTTQPTNFTGTGASALVKGDMVDIAGTASAGAAGYVGVDWGHVNAPTTTVNLSGTTISTSQAVASVSGAVGSVTGAVGSVTGAVGSVTGNVGGDVQGKVLGGGSSTITGAGVQFNNTSIATVTTVTNAVVLPSIPNNWITAAGIAASALNGKGDWLVSSSYPANFGSLAIASGTGAVTVGTNNDKTGYSLTQSFPANFGSLGISVGGHISNVDTLTTYTGNTPQTGDAYAIVNSGTFGLSALHTQIGSPMQAGTNVTVGTNLDKSGYTISGTITTLDGLASHGDSTWATATGFALASVWTSGRASELDAIYGKLPANNMADETLVIAATNSILSVLNNGTFGLSALHTQIGSPMQAGSTVILSSNGLDSVVVETGLNARQSLSIISSAVAGVLAGGGTTSVTINGAGVGTVRITATTDLSGNRSAVTLTPP